MGYTAAQTGHGGGVWYYVMALRALARTTDVLQRAWFLCAACFPIHQRH
jgi:hypothetical protein